MQFSKVHIYSALLYFLSFKFVSYGLCKHGSYSALLYAVLQSPHLFCFTINYELSGCSFNANVSLILAQLIIHFCNQVSSYRASVSSFREQASHRKNVPFVKVPYKLCQSFQSGMIPTSPVEVSWSFNISMLFCNALEHLHQISHITSPISCFKIVP